MEKKKVNNQSTNSTRQSEKLNYSANSITEDIFIQELKHKNIQISRLCFDNDHKFLDSSNLLVSDLDSLDIYELTAILFIGFVILLLYIILMLSIILFCV